MANGVKNLGFVEQTTFQIGEFSIPRGVYAIWMVVSGPKSPKGSSPDFDKGPIIPNSICPITSHGETFLNGALTNPFLGDITVPSLDQFPCHPWFMDGHSHIPIFYGDSKDFGPTNINPAGTYQYRVQMRDQTGSGWNVTVQFQITAKKG
jgi:hypothetical protein